MFWPFTRKTASPGNPPDTPTPVDSPRRFVIPDIHGCNLTLKALVEEVLALKKADDLYLLGDYIDRGPRSREVLEYLMQLVQDGYSVFPLRGNHEEMFLASCGNREQYRDWILNGGCATLDNFRVLEAGDIPLPFRRFCAGLPYYYLLDDYLLVHAGINLDAEDPYADTQSMLWNRTRSINKNTLGGRTLICGHTPHRLKDIEKMVKRDTGLISLDNGCYMAGRTGLGTLLALELNSRVLYSQNNIDYPEW